MAVGWHSEPVGRKLATLALAASLVSSAALVTMLALRIDSSQDLVKLRNAFLIEVGDSDVHEWRPDRVPSGFLEETMLPPAHFVAIGTDILGSERVSRTAWENAVVLARHLVHNRNRPADPIKSNTDRAYRLITEEGKGYCADYTQVFGALALSVGIAVREWGMSSDGYGGVGHAFNEVFDPERDKWIFIDSFYSFYVVDHEEEPLSFDELRVNLVADNTDDLRVVPIDPSHFFFRPKNKAFSYYSRGIGGVFMVWGNNIFTYESNLAVRVGAGVSRSAEQLSGILFGVHPRMMVARDQLDVAGRAELQRLRMMIYALSIAFLVSIMSGGFLIWGHRGGQNWPKGPKNCLDVC